MAALLRRRRDVNMASSTLPSHSSTLPRAFRPFPRLTWEAIREVITCSIHPWQNPEVLLFHSHFTHFFLKQNKTKQNKTKQNKTKQLFGYASCGEGNGNPLQYSCLENPMGRGAWWTAVHGVLKSQTRLSNFTHFHYTSCRSFSCGTWDLVPWPGIKLMPPALGGWSLSCRTSREVPIHLYFVRYFTASLWGQLSERGAVCVCVCVCVCLSLSCVQLFAHLYATHQAPLSLEFSR